MGATYLTALRTAAGSGVATQLCARVDSKSALIIGAGMQGEQHIHAILAVRPALAEITVANRSLPRAQALIEKMRETYGERVRFEALSCASLGQPHGKVRCLFPCGLVRTIVASMHASTPGGLK